MKRRLLLVNAITATIALSQTATTTPTFRSAIPVLSGGNFAAIADINMDGKNDIVALQSNNQFSISFGNGDGSFQSPRSYDMSSLTGALPDSLVVADLNHDGFPDIAVVHGTTTASGFGNTATVHLNDKTGNFTSPGTVFTTGGSDVAIAAGDLNGDGYPDLAIGSLDAGAVYVHLGNGDGTFGSPTVVQTGAPYVSAGYRANALKLVDVNADGRLDLVVCNMSANSVSVLLGKGNGAFGVPRITPVPGGPDAVVTGNFGILNHIDIAVGLSGVSSVAVLAGKGTGLFAAPSFHPIAGNAGTIAAADLFNRGHLDLIAASPGTVSFLTNNLAGGFNTFSEMPALIGSWFAVGRLDGDGLPDLALAYSAGQTTEVLLNDSVNGCFIR
jgi:FG-GAP-like repeat